MDTLATPTPRPAVLEGPPPNGISTVQRASWCIATLASGLAAGFFWAYDVSVTRGTALLDDGTYVATMRAINATVRTPQFFAVFFGALALGGLALCLRLNRPRAWSTWFTAAGVALYLSAFLITAAVNVPLNERLEEGTVTRTDYEGPWNRANTTRTVASVASFAAFLTAGAADTAGWRTARRART